MSSAEEEEELGGAAGVLSDSVEEDVAISLLMLSRDTSWEEPLEKKEPKKTTAKPVHLPRNSHDSDSDDDSALSIKSGDGGGGGGIKSNNRRSSSYHVPNSTSPKQQREVAPPPAMRNRHKCPGCGRVFSSYRALGSHLACHKRFNTSCSNPKATPPPETRASLSTPTDSPVSVATGIGAAKKVATAAAAAEKFQCPVCVRVFASRQAMGWHKRWHVMADAAASSDDTAEQEHSVTAAGSLDPNFPPAP